MQLRRLFALSLAATALWAGAAAAQHAPSTLGEADATGLVLGLQVTGGGLHVNGPHGPGGGGLGLSAGYGLSDRVTLFARGGVGYRMSNVDVGARYRLGAPGAALRPYLEAAVTRTAGSAPHAELGPADELVEGTRHMLGYGVAAGGGVEYAITRSLGLDVGVTFARGRFTTAEFAGTERDIREDFRTTRLNVGVTWRP
jgi:opacity protein-like surface antigen